MRQEYKPKPQPPTFWVVNVSNRNVSLSDLALTIKAYTTVNLLDSRHYSYTKEQLEKSLASGSLFAKRGMIRKRVVPPTAQNKILMPIVQESVIPGRERSVLDVKQQHYEELEVDAKEDLEKFAEENADTAILDQQPQLIKRNT